MGKLRVYAVRFAGVSVGALQDLIAGYCGSSMAIELHGIVIGQVTGTTVANLNLSVKRFPSGYSSGSGGSALTPQPVESGDHSATFTARVNDTVQATGSPVTLHSDVFNTVNGYQFFWPPDDRPEAGISQALIVSLDTAPGAAMTMSGTAYFAERV